MSEDKTARRRADAPRTRPPDSNEFSEGRKGTFFVDHGGPVEVNPADFQPVDTKPAASTDQTVGSDEQ